MQQILSFPSSLNGVGICVKDVPFTTDVGIINLHPTKGTKWNAYITRKYFDSYGMSSTEKLSKFVLKRKGSRLNSGNKIWGSRQKKTFFIAALCLHKIYSTKYLGMGFKPAVLTLYNPMI